MSEPHIQIGENSKVSVDGCEPTPCSCDQIPDKFTVTFEGGGFPPGTIEFVAAKETEFGQVFEFIAIPAEIVLSAPMESAVFYPHYFQTFWGMNAEDAAETAEAVNTGSPMLADLRLTLCGMVQHLRRELKAGKVRL